MDAEEIDAAAAAAELNILLGGADWPPWDHVHPSKISARLRHSLNFFVICGLECLRTNPQKIVQTERHTSMEHPIL